MSSIKKRVGAFTLSEMLVVLLLTVVVVGLAFAILNLVQQQMHVAKDNFEQGTERNQLRQALWHDFRAYPNIYFDSNQQRLSFENEMGKVHYQFFDTYLVRDTDTFNIALSERIFYFEGAEVHYGNVNAVELTTDKRTGSRKIFVYRENAADFYMNNDGF